MHVTLNDLVQCRDLLPSVSVEEDLYDTAAEYNIIHATYGNTRTVALTSQVGQSMVWP